jgi:hypothetical protein
MKFPKYGLPLMNNIILNVYKIVKRVSQRDRSFAVIMAGL